MTVRIARSQEWKTADVEINTTVAVERLALPVGTKLAAIVEWTVSVDDGAGRSRTGSGHDRLVIENDGGSPVDDLDQTSVFISVGGGDPLSLSWALVLSGDFVDLEVTPSVSTLSGTPDAEIAYRLSLFGYTT